MEVIEVQDGFSLEKPAAAPEPGVSGAVRRGEQQQAQISAMNHRESHRMSSAVNRSIPAPPRVTYTHEIAEDDWAEWRSAGEPRAEGCSAHSS